MDYAGMTAGVTVMLPVYEPGALLFIGDAHARQGEGEVSGTGLETSMDVEFTVDLIKSKTVGWPRLETDTHFIVLGSARPLLEALQHATSEMQRWLVADHGFSERGAATFMGQALEYQDCERRRSELYRRRQSSKVSAATKVIALEPIGGVFVRWMPLFATAAVIPTCASWVRRSWSANGSREPFGSGLGSRRNCSPRRRISFGRDLRGRD